MNSYIPDLPDLEDRLHTGYLIDGNRLLVSKVPICEKCYSNRFIQQDGMISCVTCGIVIKENVGQADVTRDTAGYSGVVNELLPQLSTKTYIAGRGNAKIKQLNFWQSNPYEESSLLHEKNNLMNILTKYCAGDSIIKPGMIEQFTNKTMMYFKVLKTSKIITRNHIKMAIIAKCFQKVCNDRYIYFTNSDLVQIFGITDRELSSGNNKLNKYSKKYENIRKHFTNSPISICDCLKFLPIIFPSINAEGLIVVKKYIFRMHELPICVLHAPHSLLAGILYNCIIVHDLKITKNDIMAKLQISESTMNKYQTLVAPYVYLL